MLFQPLFDFFFSSIQFNNFHSKNIKEKTIITDILAIIDASLYHLLYIILTNIKLSRYLHIMKYLIMFNAHFFVQKWHWPVWVCIGIKTKKYIYILLLKSAIGKSSRTDVNYVWMYANDTTVHCKNGCYNI
jgi:hypothetical protein